MDNVEYLEARIEELEQQEDDSNLTILELQEEIVDLKAKNQELEIKIKHDRCNDFRIDVQGNSMQPNLKKISVVYDESVIYNYAHSDMIKLLAEKLVKAIR